MMAKTLSNRWMVAITTGALAIASFAPMAYAGHGEGHGPKYRGVVFDNRGGWGHYGNENHGYWRGGGWGNRVVVREHHSSVGPALAGLVGGFILGTAVSHASQPVVHERVVYRDVPDNGYYAPQPVSAVCYYDPFSGQRFSSLDACADYCQQYDGPRMIEVIDTNSGQCRDRMTYDDVRWVTYHRDPCRDRGYHSYRDTYDNGGNYYDQGRYYDDRGRGDDDDDN